MSTVERAIAPVTKWQKLTTLPDQRIMSIEAGLHVSLDLRDDGWYVLNRTNDLETITLHLGDRK